jgi:RNA polymerase sigma-70 factor, ECF subfamily
LTGELQREVRAAVMRLSDKLRAVVILHDLEGLSYEEIATALEIPLGTVKSRLFNARAELRELLAGYVQGQGTSASAGGRCVA